MTIEPSKGGLTFAEHERLYEALAKAIDSVGVERETLMLARLALLLADDSGNCEQALLRIAQAVAASRYDAIKPNFA